jgi:hypothetical protein
MVINDMNVTWIGSAGRSHLLALFCSDTGDFRKRALSPWPHGGVRRMTDERPDRVVVSIMSFLGVERTDDGLRNVWPSPGRASLGLPRLHDERTEGLSPMAMPPLILPRPDSSCGKVFYFDRRAAEGHRIALGVWIRATGRVREGYRLAVFRCKRCGGFHIGQRRIDILREQTSVPSHVDADQEPCGEDHEPRRSRYFIELDRFPA